MLLFDVNVLVHAYRPDADRHAVIRPWLEEVLNTPSNFGLSELAASGFLRVVTHPKVFKNPDPIEDAFAFLDLIMQRPNCVPVKPGPRHWDIFKNLCREAGAKGNLVPDAYFAALAIEHGCEWATTDRDYTRFKDLKLLTL